MTVTEPANDSITVNATIARKQDDLPRFVVIPSLALAPWSLTGTTLVEVTLDDVAVARRTVKRWDADRWFFNITQKDCARTGCKVGDSVSITMRRASDALPAELEALLLKDAAAARAWQQFTPSRQRMLREHVAAARHAATRERRARRALCPSPPPE